MRGGSRGLEIYTGEEEEDSMDDLSMIDIIQPKYGEVDQIYCPIVDIPWDRYRKYWQPWLRVLILKVPGKSISFRVLQERIPRLWQLLNSCERVDVDKGYIVGMISLTTSRVFWWVDSYFNGEQGGQDCESGH